MSPTFFKYFLPLSNHTYLDSSLAATIKEQRPDIQLNIEEKEIGAPIRMDPPPRLLEQQTPEIADIGQPITACFMTTTSVDPTNW